MYDVDRLCDQFAKYEMCQKVRASRPGSHSLLPIVLSPLDAKLNALSLHNQIGAHPCM